MTTWWVIDEDIYKWIFEDIQHVYKVWANMFYKTCDTDSFLIKSGFWIALKCPRQRESGLKLWA